MGIMQGVIAGIAPDRKLIDLCHETPPGDISAAGLMLEASLPYFPAGSVFCCVVDPGVGTDRRVLIARVQRGEPGDTIWLVAPDNGLIPTGIARPAYARQTRYFAFDPDAHPQLVPANRSTTFHGRDIFAPLAAHISLRCAGQPENIADLATTIDDPVQPAIEWKAPAVDRRGARGHVRYVDRFGNLITNLRFADLAAAAPGGADGRNLWRLRAGGEELRGVSESYGEHAAGAVLMYSGSMDYLEIAVNRGRASDQLGCAVGAPIELQFPDS